MCINGDNSSHQLIDATSLALSAAQVRSSILDDADLFSKFKKEHSIELIQLDSDPSRSCKTITFEDAAQLSAHFRARETLPIQYQFPIEIYLIHQEDTWSPLNVSREMISTLLDCGIVGSGYLHLLASFRSRYLPTEEGFSGASQRVVSPGRSEFGWVYKYSEKKVVSTGDPWRIRHTGIYQVNDLSRGKFVFFLISPNPTAYFASYLRESLLQSQVRCILLSNPTLLHMMLISSHLFSWRQYLEYHEALLLKLDMKSACTNLEEPLVSFDTLKAVRLIEEHLLPIEQIITSFNMHLDGVQRACKEINNSSNNDEQSHSAAQAALEQFRSDAISYRNQAMHLLKKAQSTAQSVSDSLNLSHQQLAQSQNNNTFILASSAREDSITIRAITLVTSFYLPFSFVATIFGMNLVDFNPMSHELAVSSQMWLYFVISVPLTALTLVCWRWRMRIYRQGYELEETKAQDDNKSPKRSSDSEMV